jgi:hypothetical protein
MRQRQVAPGGQCTDRFQRGRCTLIAHPLAAPSAPVDLSFEDLFGEPTPTPLFDPAYQAVPDALKKSTWIAASFPCGGVRGKELNKAPKQVTLFVKLEFDADLVRILKEHLGGRRLGFVFQSRNGRPLRESNILKRHLHPILPATRSAEMRDACVQTRACIVPGHKWSTTALD